MTLNFPDKLRFSFKKTKILDAADEEIGGHWKLKKLRPWRE